MAQCKKLVRLAALAASDDLKNDAKLAKLLQVVSGGKGRGRCRKPLFSPDVDRQVTDEKLLKASTLFFGIRCVHRSGPAVEP